MCSANMFAESMRRMACTRSILTGWEEKLRSDKAECAFLKWCANLGSFLIAGRSQSSVRSPGLSNKMISTRPKLTLKN